MRAYESVQEPGGFPFGGFLRSLLIGLAATASSGIALAAVFTAADMPDGTLRLFANIAYVLGGAAAGFTFGRKSRRSGLLNGLLAGLALFAVLYLAGSAAGGGMNGGTAVFIPLITVPLVAAFAGTIGINTVSRRSYR